VHEITNDKVCNHIDHSVIFFNHYFLKNQKEAEAFLILPLKRCKSIKRYVKMLQKNEI
jgi:hypothetical protein